MEHNELIQTFDRLRNLPAETEIVEFKEAKNNFDFSDLGKYFSALCNEANLKNKPYAWLVFGIENQKHKIGNRLRDTILPIPSCVFTFAASNF